MEIRERIQEADARQLAQIAAANQSRVDASGRRLAVLFEAGDQEAVRRRRPCCGKSERALVFVRLWVDDALLFPECFLCAVRV